MRVILSYYLKDPSADSFCGSHNFPNIETAWDWFNSHSKDCTLKNGCVVKARYTDAKVHNLEQLYQSAVCNMGMGSVVAQTWIDDKNGKQHLADVLVSSVQ